MSDFDQWYTDQVENNTFYLDPEEIAKSGFTAGVKSKEEENKRLRTVLENTVKHPETMISDEKIKTEILPNIKHRNDCWVLDVTPKAHPATTPACLCYEHALIRAGMEMTKKNGKSRKSKNHRLKVLEAEIKKLKDELATTLLEKRTLRNYIIKYVEDNPTNKWALHFGEVLTLYCSAE